MNPNWLNDQALEVLFPSETLADEVGLPQIMNEIQEIFSDFSISLGGRVIEFERSVNLLLGPPHTIQKYPTVYSTLKSFDDDADGRRGSLIRYEIEQRLLFQNHDPQIAEIDLIYLADLIPALFKRNSALNGLLGSSGEAKISRGRAGWANIGGAPHKALDFTLIVIWQK